MDRSLKRPANHQNDISLGPLMALSEEQLRRIEANRNRALQLRKAKQNNASLPSSSGCALKNISGEKTSVSVAQSSTLAAKAKNSSLGGLASKISNNLSVQSGKGRSNNKEITVKCVLISGGRFEIHSPYHPAMIELFRSLPKEKVFYNAVQRSWAFHVDMYPVVAESISKCKPPVKFDGLPLIVQNVLKQKQTYCRGIESELCRIDSKIKNQLFPFQLEAVKFAISRKGRLLIADEMGLGKTVEALAVASYYRNEWPLLVVCPSSMKYTWVEEIENRLPFVNSNQIVVLNTGRDSLPNPSDCSVLITSYDFMVNQSEALIGRKFSIVILDESHNIKNFRTQRYKVATKLLKAAKRVILLSGTPALSKPSELYTQIDCIAPRMFKNFLEFGQRYCNPKMIKLGSKTVYDYSGASNLEELQLILKETIMLRRTKDQVLSQLPPKIRKVVVLNKQLINLGLESLQSAKEKMDQSFGKHEFLLSYFAETAQAKIQATIEYISELIESNQKFIIFAHHMIMLDAISEFLSSKVVHTEYIQLPLLRLFFLIFYGVQFIRIDGTVNSNRRKIFCDDFQTCDKIRVALLSITAASTGLTLTSARLVVFAELFWNPGILVQAEDRAHRVGQINSVLIIYLVAKGTADDNIWTMIKKKLEILKMGGLSDQSFQSVEGANADSTFDTTNVNNSKLEMEVSCQMSNVNTDSTAITQKSIDDFFSDLRDEDFNFAFDGDIMQNQSKNASKENEK
ncbi:SWI/SNF-related matrix-associated actin-dependent regulator of chromatin subfamily A-like protein 1 [Trichinella zimbabwensis]|uniref:SWI/SNF-related matrix-associated actin-dependent regulator of chromatin subfamily A-like protein 1 n=1 Tax=Trichinella zimbabwensis TaxID=268475 RepID=A0A0V1I7B4_9BILA|nr:SWI/SNF-related matrix-associated actin-dependent regulator of chromatin subfamily A-like protein 1 [Trichinella zimbabwensis]